MQLSELPTAKAAEAMLPFACDIVPHISLAHLTHDDYASFEEAHLRPDLAVVNVTMPIRGVFEYDVDPGCAVDDLKEGLYSEGLIAIMEVLVQRGYERAIFDGTGIVFDDISTAPC